MADSNGNVKWYQLITVFIILLGIFVTIQLAEVKAIVNNDRIRESEDKRVETKLERYQECVHSIDTRLTRIEENVGDIKKWFVSSAEQRKQ